MYSKEEAKKLRTEFWTLFGRLSKPKLNALGRKKWVLYNTKIPGLEFKFEVEKSHVAVLLEINEKDELRRIELYEKIDTFKSLIPFPLVSSLTWELIYTRSSMRDVSRIYVEKSGLSFYDKTNWPDIFEFLSNNMLQFEVFYFEIKDLLLENHT